MENCQLQVNWLWYENMCRSPVKDWTDQTKQITIQNQRPASVLHFHLLKLDSQLRINSNTSEVCSCWLAEMGHCVGLRQCVHVCVCARRTKVVHLPKHSVLVCHVVFYILGPRQCRLPAILYSFLSSVLIAVNSWVLHCCDWPIWKAAQSVLYLEIFWSYVSLISCNGFFVVIAH